MKRDRDKRTNSPAFADLPLIAASFAAPPPPPPATLISDAEASQRTVTPLRPRQPAPETFPHARIPATFTRRQRPMIPTQSGSGTITRQAGEPVIFPPTPPR